jgi:DNA-binding response OmpR family regulator
MRVLIIEDNPDILANLYGFLEPLGYTLDSARNGFAGLARAAEGRFDAIVLDLMLPGMDGLDVCRKLRDELGQSTPVLMLTARDTLQDKVDGFEHGADDYLVKPFSLVELDARLKALVRRARGAHREATLRYGPLRFDPTTFEAARDERPLALTPTGYKLLGALIRAAPRVLSKEALEHEVWGDDPPDSDALRTHIHALRQALDKPFATAMLKTVQGVGYRLTDPDAH